MSETTAPQNETDEPHQADPALRGASYPALLFRGLPYALLSIALHILVIALLHYLQLASGLVHMQIEWSDAPLTGIGTYAEVLDANETAAHTPDDDQSLSQEQPPEDVPTFAERHPPPAPEEEAPPPEAPPPTTQRQLRPIPVYKAKVRERQRETPTHADEPTPPLPPQEEDPSPIEDHPDQEADDAVASRVPLVDDPLPQRHAAAAVPTVGDFGPGNARLIVLIRNDRVRESRYEDSVRKLLTAFPDYQVTLRQSGIDPLNALDALLIATPDPRVFAETFLAVQHTLSDAQIQDSLNQSFSGSLAWQELHGRPLAVPIAPADPEEAQHGRYQRVVYMPNPSLVLYLPFHLLHTLGDPNQVETAEPMAERSLLQTLQEIAEVDGAAGSNPAVFVMVRGITSLTFGAGLPPLPAPIALSASISADDNPRLLTRLEFTDPATAQDFISRWPAFLNAVARLRLPGLAPMLRAIELSQEGVMVYGDGELNGSLVGLLLMFIANSLPTVGG